jgi:hypothetical protein
MGAEKAVTTVITFWNRPEAGRSGPRSQILSAEASKSRTSAECLAIEMFLYQAQDTQALAPSLRRLNAEVALCAMSEQ